jgi:predicted lipoprotein with Yx(FWY)xxD motif
MKRLISVAMALPAAVAVAACGGGGSGGTSGAAVSNASPTTVSVRQLPAVGSVLVDQAGKALYTSDLEARGKVVCDTAACNAFWKPLTPSGAKPTASTGAGKLGVITRPDGSRQVTDNGKPLYTFSEDSPGKATGNGFHDAFGGHHFTWNVVPAAGNTGSASASGSSGSAPTNSGGSGAGYGY